MRIPPRGRTGHGTYFVTASTWMKTPLLQSERAAGLFIAVMLGYRGQGKFFLHEFVVMPDHFHLLLTPAPELTLERSVQLIKGGFSFRMKRELGYGGEVWEKSFHDHRVRDAADYAASRKYIYDNPVRRGLASSPQEFPFSSADGRYQLDEIPQRLKPLLPAAAAMDR